MLMIKEMYSPVQTDTQSFQPYAKRKNKRERACVSKRKWEREKVKERENGKKQEKRG